jgi:hypothetical protein
VTSGSREENASKQEAEVFYRFRGTVKDSGGEKSGSGFRPSALDFSKPVTLMIWDRLIQNHLIHHLKHPARAG